MGEVVSIINGQPIYQDGHVTTATRRDNLARKVIERLHPVLPSWIVVNPDLNRRCMPFAKMGWRFERPSAIVVCFHDEFEGFYYLDDLERYYAAGLGI